jgi:cell fate (sporulation/competence/biofilm development) regulator YlbF (YheA/YmcA/DUF963 family)
MTTKKEENKKNEPGFWDETKDNINEGAKAVGDEARELGEKISAYSETIFGKIKENTNDLLQSGKELTQDAVNRAQELAEKYRDRTEIKKLNEEKKKVAAQLGMSFYLILKNNDNKVPNTILRRKAIKTTLQEMEELDQKILDLSDDDA